MTCSQFSFVAPALGNFVAGVSILAPAAINLHAMGFVGLAPVALSFGILWLTRGAPEAR